jgi:hypothetical protein
MKEIKMSNLTNEEKIKKYEEMIEKRRSYSRKHYYKTKELVELGKKLLEQQKKEVK